MLGQRRAICQRGYAKLNLSLDVCGLREDGFHEVAMIMQTIRLWDEVTAELIPAEEGIAVECNLPYIPRDERNLAVRAARLFLERCGIESGVRLHIFKKIPVSAGLAGGSADAAATLKALNLLFDQKLSMPQLIELGSEIGSDVPYCLIGGTCLATGRGETVERIRPMPEAFVVLVKPDFSVSTPWAYARFDELEPQAHPDLPAMQEAIAAADWEGIARGMVNLLEPAVIGQYPVLESIREKLLEHGALAALMSGSGPTMYGIFEKEKAARRCFYQMKKLFPSRYTFILRELYQPAGKRRFHKPGRRSDKAEPSEA